MKSNLFSKWILGLSMVASLSTLFVSKPAQARIRWSCDGVDSESGGWTMAFGETKAEAYVKVLDKCLKSSMRCSISCSGVG